MESPQGAYLRPADRVVAWMTALAIGLGLLTALGVVAVTGFGLAESFSEALFGLELVTYMDPALLALAAGICVSLFHLEAERRAAMGFGLNYRPTQPAARPARNHQARHLASREISARPLAP